MSAATATRPDSAIGLRLVEAADEARRQLERAGGQGPMITFVDEPRVHQLVRKGARCLRPRPRSREDPHIGASSDRTPWDGDPEAGERCRPRPDRPRLPRARRDPLGRARLRIALRAQPRHRSDADRARQGRGVLGAGRLTSPGRRGMKMNAQQSNGRLDYGHALAPTDQARTRLQLRRDLGRNAQVVPVQRRRHPGYAAKRCGELRARAIETQIIGEVYGALGQ